jgi:outer membrane protein OmpA-like peptidoglycan-associated protein
MTINERLISYRMKKIVSRAVSVLLGMSCLLKASSQSGHTLQLAEKYFAAGEYYTAAFLYGQYLHPAVRAKSYGDFPLYNKKVRGAAGQKALSRADVLYRQAESYRLSNYWTEASQSYKESYAQDPAAHPAALYWYAVCQRSLNQYDAAYESLVQFFASTPQDAILRSAAEKELETLRFIKKQLQKEDIPLYHIEKVIGAGLPEKGFFAPAASGTSLVFFTTAQKDSVGSPAVNPNHNRLSWATLEDGQFRNISPVPFESLDGSLNQGTASLHPDGTILYFTQWSGESGKPGASIYMARKKENAWSAPLLLAGINSEGSSSRQPFCTPDGKYLYFSSNREGGQGGFDIWYAPVLADGTTGSPVNAGTQINTAGDEAAPYFHQPSQTLVFASDGWPGMGGYDLFTAKGGGTSWQKPDNLGYPVNSARDDIYFFATGKTLLDNAMLSSDRGNSCCLATYTVSKTQKSRIITGFVFDCRDNQPLANAELLLKDRNGKAVNLITGADGRYKYDAASDYENQVTVSKEKYETRTMDLQFQKTVETNWKTDTVYNAAVCIEKKLVIKVENVVTVYFDFDQSLLKERAQSQLDSIYTVLAENPAATIQISGYTDGLGSVDYNKKLSDRRAKACADYLTGRGIGLERISFESFGACCPVEMELLNGRDNPDGRSRNRRALINISKD